MNRRSLGLAHASKGAARLAKKPLPSRRDFLHCLTAGVCATAYLSGRTATAPPASGETAAGAVRTAKTAAAVGSLFPFIPNQAVKTDLSLSFLNPKVKNDKGLKGQGPGQALEPP